VWLSRYELDLWSAFGALGGVLRDELRPSDCIQINMSSRATATVQLTVSAYRLVGARTRVLGVVPVEDSIDSLLDGGDAAPTLLSAYPSYLAQLVREARRRALGPDDFHLRRIDCGGEVLSPSLVRAATETFGAEVGDVFGMTEVLPVRARVCEHGHLHHDVTMGFTEVVNLDSGSPCAPGEVGSLVITPYYPYRECMPVFRHDTRDLVRSLPEGELTCSLAAMPATSTVLGKAGHVLSIDGRIITPRELVEVLESLPGQPWPARFSATALADHLRIELSRDTAGELSPADLQRHIASRTGGVPVVCRVVDGDAALGLRRLRADLIEHTFTRQEA
jgi:phenylacetate-coenzyme A ligase PaaK-like adenylate-forming protein